MQAALADALPGLTATFEPLILSKVSAEIDRLVDFRVGQVTEQMEAVVMHRVEVRIREIMGAVTTSRAQVSVQVQAVQAQLGAAETALKNQDRAAWRNNIVVQNAQENQEGGDIRSHVVGLLQVPTGALMEAKRLGAPRPRPRPRDILVCFTDFATKAKAFSKFRELRGNRVFLDDHLTPVQVQQRHGKMERYRQLREQGRGPTGGAAPSGTTVALAL